ncbi:hypothetical protein [Gymnodinialimonas sp. 57CJ19]|uniref:hypothetical protein n=1 Tax=Gymnodinialimonas sp. 57CJ19 TaxID=3138498 RepID=UPI0031343162
MTTQQKTVAAWLGGSVALALVGGWVFGLVFFLQFGAWMIAKWNPWAGLGAAVLVLAAFFGPALFDDRVFDAQLAEIQAQEVTDAPLDLRGQTVLFLGMSGRYHPVDCSDLCRNVAAFAGAQGVYFGFDRSLDLSLPEGQTVDLLYRDIRTFAGPLQTWPGEGTALISATPERIDYVVFEGGYLSAGLRDAALPEVSDVFGLYPFDTIFTEYAIYAVDDPTAFDVTTTAPLFTRFEVTRHRATAPGIPFALLGDRTYDHRYGPGQSQWNSLNTRAAATFLCAGAGPARQAQCVDIP